MKRVHYPIIAKEGHVHIAIALGCGCLASWLWGGGSVIVWLLVLFVVQFFRDPKRRISTEKGAVISPASGKIVAVGKAENPYLDGVESLRVSVFMNVFSVHSNLIPIAGTVKGIWYHAGKFLNAALDKSSSENERNAIWIRTQGGDDIICVQIAGLIARRILCYVKKGEEVEIGQRYGFIRFGSRVDIYMPLTTKLTVQLDQKVESGNDVLGFVTAGNAG